MKIQCAYCPEKTTYKKASESDGMLRIEWLCNSCGNTDIEHVNEDDQDPISKLLFNLSRRPLNFVAVTRADVTFLKNRVIIQTGDHFTFDHITHYAVDDIAKALPTSVAAKSIEIESPDGHWFIRNVLSAS